MRRVISRSATFFVWLLALFAACSGKDASTKAPGPAPVASTPQGAEGDLEARLGRLTTRLEEAMEQYHVPGMAVAVVRGDEVIYRRGFGWADREKKIEAKPETLFAIGSTTKAFTATLVGMLVADGKMGWDDPLQKHLPELKLKVNGKGEATLRDALCHRTGFPRMSLLWIAGAVPRTEVLQFASKAEPTAAFREKFLYNNVTYMAAGEASGRAAGTSWEALLQSRILDPLGMRDATVSVPQALKDPRLARGYQWESDEETYRAMPMRDLAAIAPAGAIVANVDVMSRWLRFQLGRGSFEGKKVVDAAVVEETWKPQIEVAKGQMEYGLGWFVRKWQNRRLIEHGGNIDGYAAQVAMLPDDELAFVLLTNVSGTPLQQASIEIVFDALLGEASEAPEEDLTPYVGTYVANFATFRDAPFKVTVQSGKLFIDIPGQTNYELAPPGKDGKRNFALTDMVAISFDPPKDGKSNVLRLYQAGAEFEVFRQGHTPPAEVPLPELAPLLGHYASKELGTIGVTVVENRLALDIPKQGYLALRRQDDGTWAARAIGGLQVKFDLGASGEATKMTIVQAGKTVECPRETSRAKIPTPEELLTRRKVEAFERAMKKAGVVEVRGKVKVPQSGIEGEATLWFDAEGRAATLVDFGRFGWIREVTLGDRAWSEGSISPTDELKGDHLAQARQKHPGVIHGDWRKAFDEVVVLEAVEARGKTRLRVTLRNEGLPAVEATVDGKTGDVLELEEKNLTQYGLIPVSWDYADYRKVAGLRLPHRMESTTEQTGRTIIEVTSVKALRKSGADLFPTAPGDKLVTLGPAKEAAPEN